MKTSLKIGELVLSPPVLSAPMADCADWAQREIWRRLGGVGLIETEMISARAVVYMGARGEGDPERLRGVESEPRPLSVQIWDNCPETLERLARRLARDLNVSAVDLNFGCPAPAIAKRSESGSYLLRDPQKVGALVERVANACESVPVTAKIRLGLTEDSINARDVAQAVEGAGGAALTVHGRTASQMYRGEADWGEIAKVKSALRRIPLIGNGDIKTAAGAVERLENYPVDGVMIGRAALERPWIFREIAALLRGETPPPEPTPRERRELLLEHFRLELSKFGDELGVVVARRAAVRYSKGLPNGRAFRDKIGRVRSAPEFLAVVESDFIVDDPTSDSI